MSKKLEGNPTKPYNDTTNRKRKRNSNVHAVDPTQKAFHQSQKKDEDEDKDKDVLVESNFIRSDEIIKPNFAHLASRYTGFAKEWEKLKQRQNEENERGRYRGSGSQESGGKSSFSTHVNFDFNIALTRAILKEYLDFDLPSMPKGNLCPPIPNRLNYVLWIKKLLCEMFHSDNEYFQQGAYNENHLEQSFKGLDIGVGASCIYPLLLCSKYFDHSKDEDNQGFKSGKGWQFLGTDVDSYSIQCAQENIHANKLQDKVKLALVPPTTDQMNVINNQNQNDTTTKASKSTDSVRHDGKEEKHDHRSTPIHTAMKAAATIFLNMNPKFDFCMTNPPFYSTIKDATKPRAGDSRDRTSMTIFESVYPGLPIGGEVKFVMDMIHDSVLYQNDIVWFSAMVGKKSSLLPIEKKLYSIGLGIGSIRKTEFVQGKMIRWGIAWTFRQPSPLSKGRFIYNIFIITCFHEIKLMIILLFVSSSNIN